MANEVKNDGGGTWRLVMQPGKPPRIQWDDGRVETLSREQARGLARPMLDESPSQ